MNADDLSSGYEAVAGEFMQCRSPSIGVVTVLRWARELPPRAEVLELGCGHGFPISIALLRDGVQLYGIDGSPTLVDAFLARVPTARVVCEALENSPFFSRSFDAALAIGVVFLLPAEVQVDVIRRVAAVLHPGGRFLFTAPEQPCTWNDVLTGRPCRSLGRDVYAAMLAETGLVLERTEVDEGKNHYYACQRKET